MDVVEPDRLESPSSTSSVRFPLLPPTPRKGQDARRPFRLVRKGPRFATFMQNCNAGPIPSCANRPCVWADYQMTARQHADGK